MIARFFSSGAFQKKGPLQRALFFFVFLSLLAGPLKANAVATTPSETSDNAASESQFSQQMLHAGPILTKAVDPTSIKIFLVGALATLGVRTQDDSTRMQWMDHQKISAQNSKVGDILGTGLPGLTIAISQIYLDPGTAGWNHLRALTWASVATDLMKLSFGRQRPGDSESHQSFPSGHTSTTFASATALTYAYGWKAAVVAYPLAVYTGLTRLSDDAHWFSDVVAGAFVGIWWGRAGVKSADDSVVWLPTFQDDRRGLAVTWQY